MNPLQPNRPRRALPVLILLAILVAAAGAAAYVFKPRFESDPPQVSLTPDVSALGGGTTVEIVVTDRGAGLRSVIATLTTAAGDHTIASEQLRDPATEKRFTLAAGKLGLKEGPATLRVHARDYSFSHLFKGNETVVEKRIDIDLTPPTIELVADDRYVSFGGVGAIVYKVSADAAVSGVKIGERFFPGFPNVVHGHPDQMFALFAHPYDTPPGTKAHLIATDKAGNTRQVTLAYELKDVREKKSTIAVSERFLQDKVAPLLPDAAARQGAPKDVFVAVNQKVRKQNEDKIAEVTRKASPAILWSGAFRQLSNSKVEANFADRRTYTYNGEAIDTAYHLGYDLSVTKHYPVEAANGGVVAFTGDLGLYGNAVILDHGLGLFTLYGHLSAIDVKAGDKIEPKQILGKTGETGFAGGDHLHYGVYLDGVAVLPVEWWDGKWIADNITPKVDGRGAESAIAARSTPARAAAHRAKRNR
jgi:murein DD-endopeptidase MepM/ murein hydrolase activator NlpD